MYSLCFAASILAYGNVRNNRINLAERGASFAFLYKLLISRKEIYCLGRIIVASKLFVKLTIELNIIPHLH